MCKLREAIVFGAILIGGVHGQSRGGGRGGLPRPRKRRLCTISPAAGFPSSQIRTTAFTALTEDEWRRSGHGDREQNAGLGNPPV